MENLEDKLEEFFKELAVVDFLRELLKEEFYNLELELSFYFIELSLKNLSLNFKDLVSFFDF